MTAAVIALDSLDLPAHLRIVRPLGTGGTAVVYEGFHERLRLPVAIKVLRMPEKGQTEAVSRLIHEAELCARLHNPHVPRIYDVDVSPQGVPYVVMELIRGQGVDAIITPGGVSYDDAVWLLSQLLSALEALHGAGIVHRDIKPENLLMQQTSGGRALLRLIDFGIAKVRDADFTSPRLTQAGTLVGTPHYIAPEVLVGQLADHRADLYAAGVTFFEMLTGRAPFDDSSVGAALAAALRDDPFPLRQVRPELGPEVEHFVARAMARAPERRFHSAGDMLAGLRAISGGLLGSESTAVPISTLADVPEEERGQPRVMASGVVRRKERGWLQRVRASRMLPWLASGLLLVLGIFLFGILSDDLDAEASKPLEGSPDGHAASDPNQPASSPAVSAIERVEPASAPEEQAPAQAGGVAGEVLAPSADDGAGAPAAQPSGTAGQAGAETRTRRGLGRELKQPSVQNKPAGKSQDDSSATLRFDPNINPYD